MPRGKGGLGRGLESLFEDAAPSLESTGVRTVPLREIEPDPAQPRKTFGEEGLAELAASIAEHGLLQPIAGWPWSKICSGRTSTRWRKPAASGS